MQTGTLQVNTTTGSGAFPVAGARVIVKDKQGQVLYDMVTDANGQTQVVNLEAPDAELTLYPNPPQQAWADYDVIVSHPNFVTYNYFNVQVVATQDAILNVEMEPLAPGMPEVVRDIVITPPLASLPTPPQLQDVEPDFPITGRALPSVAMPEYITVHLGAPSNTAAQNVRVKFIDYVKNVTSSEIYSTWPENSIIANIHVIVTFALNRIYTQWYPSRGRNFDITNSTAYDQYFVYGRDIYANISRLVDQYFRQYARRPGFRNPFFTQYCNGTTAFCKGLSQWGTVTLANQGYTPLGILRYFYPSDLILDTAPISNVTTTWPGYSLYQGMRDPAVAEWQRLYIRIRQNYPGLPEIIFPTGFFGVQTAAAVRAFQRLFNMQQTGVIDQLTWNKAVQTFVAVTRLAELNSEGELYNIGTTPPTTALSRGATGPLVSRLQYMLTFLSFFYPEIPPVEIAGTFGPRTLNSVIAFQRRFGIPQTGTVAELTWGQLFRLYNNLRDSGVVV